MLNKRITDIDNYSSISPQRDREALYKFSGVYIAIALLIAAVVFPGDGSTLQVLRVWIGCWFAMIFLSMCGYNYLTYGKVTPWMSMLGRYKYWKKWGDPYYMNTYKMLFKKYEIEGGKYLSFPRPILWII